MPTDEPLSWRMRPRFYQAATGALLLSALLILWLGQATDIDLRLADWFYDRSSHSFPWHDSWFAAVFVHLWLKYACIGIGVAVMAVCLVDLLRPLRAISPLRRAQIRVVALSAVVVPMVISLLKHHSALHCPWDIDRYGGAAPYLRLLERIPHGWHAGHCFPAGHASSALWLAAFAVFWLPRQPGKALTVFCCGLGVGLFLGWVQQMRGAHFLTHTLWSAWIASALILLLIGLFAAKRG